jgi:hypothetical protein
MGGVHVKETVIENNSQVKFLLTLRIDKDTDLLTNNWIDESFEYLARGANAKHQDYDKTLILIIKRGLGKLEYVIDELTYEYEGQGKKIKVKQLVLITSDNKKELKVIFERRLSIREKLFNYLKEITNRVLKSYKDKRAELKRFNQQELESLIKNNTKEKED